LLQNNVQQQKQLQPKLYLLDRTESNSGWVATPGWWVLRAATLGGIISTGALLFWEQ